MERLTAEGIIKIYTAMQVDAVAVGPLDLASGLSLLQTSQQQGFPWLSANLLDQKGYPLFQPMLIKKIGRIKAGVIGLTGTLSPLPPDITRAEWQTVLPALIEETNHQCDILILLSSLSSAENREIAQQFPTLHLIFTADLRSDNMPPQQINNTLITQTDRQGKYQGILTIDWNKSGKWGKTKEEELVELHNRLSALDWQLQRMEQRKDLQQPAYIEKMKLVKKDRETVAKQINTLQNLATVPVDEETYPCIYNNNFLALQRSLPEADKIKAIITEIKQQVNTLHK